MKTRSFLTKLIGPASCLFLTLSAQAATIGKSVWRDLNGNGIREQGEPGVPKAKIRLYVDFNGDGFAERKVQETITDAKGNYKFTDIKPGLYSVGIDLLSLPEDLYEITPVDMGSDESIDSDVDQHICRSRSIEVTRAGQNFTNRGDVGLLVGDPKVTHWGNVKGYEIYTYQDHYLRTKHHPRPKGRKYFEMHSKWLKWYVQASRRQQMLAKIEGWLDKQRAPFSPDGKVPKKQYRGVMNLAGEGSTGYQDGRGYWTGGSKPEHVYANPDEIARHTICIYEGYRGTVSRIKWRTTSTDELLYPWMMTAMEIATVTGSTHAPGTEDMYVTAQDFLDLLDEWERRTDKELTHIQAFPRRYGLLASTNVTEFEYLPKGSKIPKMTKGRSLTSKILVKLGMELGYEKYEEALDNLAMKKFWPASVGEGAITFKASVLSAVKGTRLEESFTRKFDTVWGFPKEDVYVPKTSGDSGPYVHQDIYWWDFTSDVDTNIRPGFTAITDRTDEGFARFEDLTQLGYMDINERDTTLQRPLPYPVDEFSNTILGLGTIAFTQKIKNGYWSVSVDTPVAFPELVIEGASHGAFPRLGGSFNRAAGNYLTEVTDGELNIEWRGEQLKYTAGLILRYLGPSYKRSTKIKSKGGLEHYHFNFGGDNLFAESPSGTIPVLPDATDSSEIFWWKNNGTNRRPIEPSGAYHPEGMREATKTGVLIENGRSCELGVSVKDGLWRVTLGVASLSKPGHVSSSFGTFIPELRPIQRQEHIEIEEYVNVVDGQLDIAVALDTSNLVLTDLKLTFISKDILKNGFVGPDANNTKSTDGNKRALVRDMKGPAWRMREVDGIEFVSADESFPSPRNDFYQLVTTLKGLTPGETYEINLIYASKNTWAIKGGLSPESLQGFAGSSFTFGGDDYVGPEDDAVSPLPLRIGGIPAYEGKLGRAKANSKGEIKVYVDDPNNAGKKTDQWRSWFLGIRYNQADFDPVPGLRFTKPTPRNGQIVNPNQSIGLEVKADVPLKRVALYHEGQLLGQLKSAPWRWGDEKNSHPLLKRLPAGQHNFKVFVVAKNNGESEIDFNVFAGKAPKEKGALTFFDATLDNTGAADGSGRWQTQRGGSNIWKNRDERDGIFSADEAFNGGPNDVVQIKTTIPGLIPGGRYAVFVHYASQGSWAIKAGLDPATLKGFSASKRTIQGFDYVGVRDPSVVRDGQTKSGADRYRGALGTVIASETGEIEVFIDDPDNPGRDLSDHHRAWYDGVSYQYLGMGKPF